MLPYAKESIGPYEGRAEPQIPKISMAPEQRLGGGRGFFPVSLVGPFEGAWDLLKTIPQAGGRGWVV